jgi:signal transduction histidine kinase
LEDDLAKILSAFSFAKASDHQNQTASRHLCLFSAWSRRISLNADEVVLAEGLLSDSRSEVLLMSVNTADVADHLERRKDEILTRWRKAAEEESAESKRLAELDDNELLDHLPAITEALICVLRGEKSSRIEDASRRHGHQRRLDGYSVLDVLWELTILRRVFLAVLREASEGVAEAVVVAARTMILDLLDLCARASIDQHVQETEQERDAAAAKAASLEIQRQRFLGALSHELRNQIQPILFGLHRLKDSNPSAQQLRALEMIERQTRHQAFLLEDLLDLNRGRLGKIELKLSSVDLRECVRHGIEANQAEVNLKSLNVKLDLPGEPIYAFVDRERICQVATNLMSNAVKFTPNGGSIVWQVFQEPSWLVMCIRDTGRGIKADDLGNIFDIFFQGQAADAGQRGLGIGLTVVKNLVELHRGTIQVHSGGDGRGTEFIVRIPPLR